MIRQMFVSLPVKDLEKSMAFYEALGFTFDPQFSGDTAARMVISEHNCVMLLTHEMFKGFATKPIPDAHETNGMLLGISCESKQAVDDMAAKAVKAGGKEPRPKADYGFMVQRKFEDLDGHTWGPMWMDPVHVQKS
jgi:predicted lactoylglutathione lyase